MPLIHPGHGSSLQHGSSTASHPTLGRALVCSGCSQRLAANLHGPTAELVTESRCRACSEQHRPGGRAPDGPRRL